MSSASKLGCINSKLCICIINLLVANCVNAVERVNETYTECLERIPAERKENESNGENCFKCN